MGGDGWVVEHLVKYFKTYTHTARPQPGPQSVKSKAARRRTRSEPCGQQDRSRGGAEPGRRRRSQQVSS